MEDHPTDTAAKEIRLPDSVQRLLTREEAAYALGLSLRAFCRILAAGEIRAVQIDKTVRIRPQEINRFVEAREGAIRKKRTRGEKTNSKTP